VDVGVDMDMGMDMGMGMGMDVGMGLTPPNKALFRQGALSWTLHSLGLIDVDVDGRG
jgi:hypothetical protein